MAVVLLFIGIAIRLFILGLVCSFIFCAISYVLSIYGQQQYAPLVFIVAIIAYLFGRR